MRILVQFPTRQRAEKFFSVLDLYRKMASPENEITYNVVCDIDDPTMNNNDVMARFKELGPTVKPRFGDHKSKIEAINDLCIPASQFDILVLASDDMIPQMPGWDIILSNAMRKHFHDLDGVLWFNDGHAKLNTMCIMGRRYYRRFGYIYHPDYISLWSDNEFAAVSEGLDRVVYTDQVVFRHEHPMNGQGGKMDEMYKRSESFYKVDEKTFHEREKRKFDFQPRSISILICSLLARHDQLDLLWGTLGEQLKAYPDSRTDALIEIDNGSMSIGEKRNKLVRRATKEYIAFVDDDDLIAGDYLKRIMDALMCGPDCVGITGTMKRGKLEAPFIHSLEYDSYFEKDGVYYRPPNHLNPIKREIAVDYPFEESNHGEDYEYSMQMLRGSALKTEVFIEEPIYFYNPAH